MSDQLRVDILADDDWAQPLLDLVAAAGQSPQTCPIDDAGRPREGDLLIVAGPDHRLAEWIDALDLQPSDHTVFVSPGLLPETGETATEYVLRHTASLRFGVLAGPLRANALAEGRLGAGVLASAFQSVQDLGAKALHSPRFRVYPSADIRGAELSKTVVEALAFGVGLVDGLGLGSTLRTMLITRGVAQASYAAHVLGAESATLTGLCGLGDLLLSLEADDNHHWAAGQALARSTSTPKTHEAGTVLFDLGLSVRHILDRMGGQTATFSLLEIVDAILRGQIGLQDALMDLMERPVRQE